MTIVKAGRAAALVISLVALGLVVRRLDPHRMARDFEDVHWRFVCASGAINLLNTFVEAMRWQVLARAVAPAARLRSTVLGLIAGTVGNVLLPFKLGDGLRAYVFAEEEGLVFASALSTVVLDRVLDVFVFAALAAVATCLAPFPPAIEDTLRSAIVLTGCGLALLVVLSRRTRAAGRAAVPRTRIGRFGLRLLDSLAALRGTRFLAPAVCLAVTSWALRTLVVWTMLKAFDVALPLSAAGVILTMLNLGIAVAGTPGNAGSFELTLIEALALYGVPKDVAFSFSTVLHVTEILPVMAIAVLMMWTGALRLQYPPTDGAGTHAES